MAYENKCQLRYIGRIDKCAVKISTCLLIQTRCKNGGTILSKRKYEEMLYIQWIMWCKKPVWYTPEEVLNKYRGLETAKFSEIFLGQLVDAYLLKGKYDRHKRKTFILEESLIVLINHINYNIYCELIQTSEQIIRYSVPSYCDNCTFSYNITYEDYLWISPSSILDEYPSFKDFKIFNERLISQLVHKKILRGRYDITSKETLVLAPSFRELHKYIQYLHDLDKF